MVMQISGISDRSQQEMIGKKGKSIDINVFPQKMQFGAVSVINEDILFLSDSIILFIVKPSKLL